MRGSELVTGGLDRNVRNPMRVARTIRLSHLDFEPRRFQIVAAPVRSHLPSWVPLFNRIARPLLAAGVPMGPDVLITVRGRKSGVARTTPVTICENMGRRGIISPFGEVNWVRNLRAAGRATITIRRRREEVAAVELGPVE